jgi:excisionase family DNA binding protein
MILNGSKLRSDMPPSKAVAASSWTQGSQEGPTRTVVTLDLAQAAHLLRVHPKTLQRLARAGQIPACKVGRSWIFVEHVLIAHLVSKSLSRVSVVDLQEQSECRSTDARTHRIGGSSCRPSTVNRSTYSKALGLPTNG